MLVELLYGKEEINVKKKVVQEAEEVTKGLEMNDDTRPRAANRRRRLSRSASLGSSTTSQQYAEMEIALSKRHCVRRESGGGTSRKTSISRPSRMAVEKVQSYKEIPLNIKMRRSH
ncbi:shugoshin-1 [Salvia divinorum]|uniref:Shugoshin-1 n=1 Tax=Salvia divinorum TaxID=28513 RepID=A0ABD1GJ00_SALDI